MEKTEVRRFEVGALQANAYLITDEATGKMAVIDPGAADAALFSAIRAGGNLQWILLTHGHADHIGAVKILREETGAQVVAHSWEQPLLQSAGLNLSRQFGCPMSFSADVTVQEGACIRLGETELKVLHTPGHTAGSVCYQMGRFLFTGDTLFAGSMGRVDFPTGDLNAMRDSLKRLAELPGDFQIFSGHGEKTTLAQERRTNPYLQRRREEKE